MSSTLAQLITRAQNMLSDDGTVFTTPLLTEALRHALDEYSQASPLIKETVLTLIADGREIALDALTTLLSVVDVHYPYDSAQTWNTTYRTTWRVWWDDARAVLHLEGASPVSGDEVRLWYGAPHTIQNLDSGSITSVPLPHESLLLLGAAGWAATIRALSLSEPVNAVAHPQSFAFPGAPEIMDAPRYSTSNYTAIAKKFLDLFHARLDKLRTTKNVGGIAYGAGFALDKWDGE